MDACLYHSVKSVLRTTRFQLISTLWSSVLPSFHDSSYIFNRRHIRTAGGLVSHRVLESWNLTHLFYVELDVHCHPKSAVM